MESLLKKIEDALVPIYKGLPDLPKGGREWLVKAAPILVLIAGIVQLIGAWDLWHAGHVANNLVTLANQAYGSNIVASSNLNLFYWLSLVVLVVEGFILLASYSGLKNKIKLGWNMLFLAVLVNALYGILAGFDGNYAGLGSFVFSIIVTAFVLYFVFEIRSYYGKSVKNK